MRENLKWIVATGAFVVICVAVYSSRSLWVKNEPVVFAQPMETLVFEDGEQLDVLQLGVGEVTDGGVVRSGGFLSNLSNSSGSRGGGGYNVSYESNDGVLEELKFSAANKSALVIEVKTPLKVCRNEF